MKIFTKIVTKLLSLIVISFIWVLLVFSFFSVSIWLDTEHYNSHDTPHERFEVVIHDAKYNTKTLSWDDAKTQPHAWKRTSGQACTEAIDCLSLEEDGSLIFHNEGALWYSQSRYRIQGNRIIPISFVMVTFMRGVLAMFFAFIALGVGKYLLKRWRLRDSAHETALYHVALLRDLKMFMIGLLFIVLFYAGIVSII